VELSRLGKLGVWTWLDTLGAAEAGEVVRKMESWGYSTLWLPEAVGRDPFALIGFLGAQTTRIVFATGIANLYARDPMAMNALRLTLGELTGSRFVLGIGVSHAHLVTGVRKHTYGQPIATMRAYLEAMKGKPYMAPAPPSEPPIVLAALRPRMLQLAKELAQGAHPYFVPPEHTARAREILGPGPWLAPEQKVLRETNPAKARTVARSAMKIYLGLPNYQNNLRWLGYDDKDLENGGSDRLVDAIVCWGDEKTIASRVQAHLDAGADHVCIQPLRPDGKPGPDLELLQALAPGRA
jgi:probable F420-dependent oxidoreductase